MSVGIAGKSVCRTTLGRLRSIINITGRSTSLSMKITTRGVVSTGPGYRYYAWTYDGHGMPVDYTLLWYIIGLLAIYIWCFHSQGSELSTYAITCATDWHTTPCLYAFKETLTFAKARPAQMIFITTSFIVYLPLQAPEADYLDAAVVSVLQIHLTQPPGDVLVS